MSTIDGENIAPRARMPRTSIALLSALHAAIFGWAAAVLPWRSWTLFGGVALTLAVAHLLTALAAAARPSLLPRVWRVSSALSALAFAYLAFEVIRSAAYLASLYGGLGEGIAAALLAGVGLVALVTLPIAAWGLAVTARPRDRAPAAAAVSLFAAALLVGGWHAASLARAEPLLGRGAELDWGRALAEARREAIPRWGELPAVPGRRPGLRPRPTSLHHREPARCVPRPGEREALAVVTHLGPRGAAAKGPVAACVRAEPERLAEAVARRIRDEAFAGPVVVDVLGGVAPLEAPSALVDSLAIRPGLDGVCDSEGCLMPWQLVATGEFTANQPIEEIPDFRFGVSAARIRHALGQEMDGAPDRLEGLYRLETRAFAFDAEGELVELVRGRELPKGLTRARLDRALELAEEHVLAAQRRDGSFRYLLQPHTGRQPRSRLNVPRQAGTTLVVCELAVEGERARQVAARSLELMASKLRSEGGLAGPVPRRGANARLGWIALPAIAFATCRRRVGDEHDAPFAKMVRALLAMQREDGGFFPELDLEGGRPVEGHEPLYAGGQAVFALVLAEELASKEPARAAEVGLPDARALGEAAVRAMDYYAGPYFDVFVRDFFWIEENWHCLAARAALRHRRHDGYERLCIDYVTFKSRLILDAASRVAPELEGGYGFGNVFVPQNTPTAGFGEALAAAMALKEARGERSEDDLARMRRVAEFLVRQQWSARNCATCAPPGEAIGGFSESMVVPDVRIDYTQHAWAALGHGRPFIGDALPEG